MTNEELHTEIALLSQQLKHITNEVENMDAEQTKHNEAIRKDIAEIKMQANKWKGGIAVVLGSSGFLIAILAMFEKFSNFFRGTH